MIDQLGPEDLAAVVFTRDSRSAQDFTPDRARLLAAAETCAPGLADPRNLLREPPYPMSEKARALDLTNTRRLRVEALGTIPERRKTIVVPP